ncbi:hypothetical protein [Actinomadura alba]|uniref:Uncharacterized protein n=1 Tax=Actinomadura alba TaxID=406431 RepID=A0ABR7LP72_9ACTN|nr:hypothetical protein [Actinomadura alba]MBC6466545.1 hypothetical protein [Actinomadura alba]
MSGICQTRRLALATALAAFISGGVLLTGRAGAALLPQGPAVSYLAVNRPLDIDNQGEAAAKAKGRSVAINQNSPTKNLGLQHNSSVNSGGQHNFQAAHCKFCKIRQKIVIKKHFWGYSNLRRVRGGHKWPSAGRAWSAARSSSSAFSGWSHAKLSSEITPTDVTHSRAPTLGSDRDKTTD